MDKKNFLDKDCHKEKEWVAEEDYDDNYTIIKVEELSYTNYEVLTTYKSGRKRTDIISAKSE